MNPKAQGTIEYLVVIAVVVVISLVVVGLVTNFFGSASSAVGVSNDISSKVGAGGISILEGVSDTNGDTVLRLKNNTGESFNVTKISGLSDGESVVDKQFNEVVVPGGGEASFSLDDLSAACVCGANDIRKVCEFEVTLTSSNGLVKKQRISESVDCVVNTTPAGSIVQPFGAIWAQGEGSGTGASDEGAASVFVDSSGNIYLTGNFKSSTIGFGNDVNLTNSGSTVYSDYFLVKYNSSGVAQWARNATTGTGSNRDDSGQDVFVDSSGNIYVAGRFKSTQISFGNDVNLTNRGMTSYSDFFVVKYNSSGTPLWARNPGQGTGTNDDIAKSVIVDSSGNVYIGGNFYSTTLGLGNDVNLTNRGANDFFIVKYSSDGNTLWGKNAFSGTGSGSDEITSITLDSSGNVYATGSFSSAISFGNDINLTNRGTTDFFVVKFNSSGVAQLGLNPTYVNPSGSTGNWGNSIFVDSSGNIYAAGYFYPLSISFGNDINLNLSEQYSYDFFVVKYNSSGVAQWARNPTSAGSGGNDSAYSVFVDSSGNVYVGGFYSVNSIAFSSDVTLPTRGSYDFFVAKYDSGGNILWAQGPTSGTSESVDYCYSTFVDSGGNVYLAGQFSSTTLGFRGDVILTNRGGIDFFIVKYGYR